MNKAKVYFVGAGPGDFELLTIKGKKYLEMADCVIYDRLVSKEVMYLVNPKAELIYLGKKSTDGGLIQDEINRTLVDKSLNYGYKNIVRLKGGDPFVFGRGGEEIEEIKKHGISYEVVPGISSSISVPTYAGIPVTHRNLSRSFHVFTGMTSTQECIQDFSVISKLEGTLIFLMGVKNINHIVDSLVLNGKDSKTPIGIIERGASPYAKTTVGTLKDIKDKTENIKPPAIIIIGEVVNKREEFKWFEDKPLFGKKIIVTREEEQGKDLVHEISTLGGEGVLVPSIKLLDKMNDFDYNILNNYQAVLFNSPNGVNFFFKHLKDIRILGHLKIGAVGSKTFEELSKYKIIPDVIPNEYSSLQLAKSITSVTSEDDNILIITSDISPLDTENLSKTYKRNYKKIAAYENTTCDINSDLTLKEISNASYLTFFSGSAVDGFFQSINEEDLPRDLKIISIGPNTSKVIKKYSNLELIECTTYTKEEILKNIELH